MTNLVHFVLARTDHRRWARPLNKALFLLFGSGCPLDEHFSKLKLESPYTGAEVEARKPAAWPREGRRRHDDHPRRDRSPSGCHRGLRSDRGDRVRGLAG